MSRAVLSLGSNLGDRFAHLKSAVEGLGSTLLVVSGVYETVAWGDAAQPPFLNAIALVADEGPDEHAPRAWLELARALETAAGRVRDPERRFGPRTLDVDVVAVWADDGTPIVCDDADVTVPHPRAHLRAFVLRPWLDVQPYARLPRHGLVSDLLRTEPVTSDLGGIVARPDLRLDPLC